MSSPVGSGSKLSAWNLEFWGNFSDHISSYRQSPYPFKNFSSVLHKSHNFSSELWWGGGGIPLCTILTMPTIDVLGHHICFYKSMTRTVALQRYAAPRGKMYRQCLQLSKIPDEQKNPTLFCLMLHMLHTETVHFNSPHILFISTYF